MSDDVVWHLIKNGFCSYRKKTDTKSFCTNVYNVTGLCNHASCPLANSNYATIIEDQGNLFLCVKNVEKSHMPRFMWKRTKLPRNKTDAHREILEGTKVGILPHLVTKCKLKYNRLLEVLRNSITAARKSERVKVVPVKKKIDKREAIREKKAKIAAKLEKSIESELLSRLSTGVYGELYQFQKEEEKETEEPELEEAAPKPTRRSARLNIEYEYNIENMGEMN